MKAKDYTPEQMENAMRYGVCPECGTPRERAQGERKTDKGTTVKWSGLVAPCGHAIDQYDPYGILP